MNLKHGSISDSDSDFIWRVHSFLVKLNVHNDLTCLLQYYNDSTLSLRVQLLDLVNARSSLSEVEDTCADEGKVTYSYVLVKLHGWIIGHRIMHCADGGSLVSPKWEAKQEDNSYLFDDLYLSLITHQARLAICTQIQQNSAQV